MISIKNFLLTYHRYILQRVCLWFRVRVQLTPTVHRSGYCVSQFAECIYIKHTTIDRWLVFIHKSFTFHHRCQCFFFYQVWWHQVHLLIWNQNLFFFKVIFFVEGGGLNIFKRITVKFYFDEKHKRLSLQFDFPQSNIYSVTYMHKK